MGRVDNFDKDILKKMKTDSFIGQVYKAHSDKYFVKSDCGIIRCGARGLIKLKGDGISVGDYVSVKNGTIESVVNRLNHFIRPNVSNVDLIAGIFAPAPKPDFLLLDKLYINAVKENIEFVIIVNKSDIEQNIYTYLQSEYGSLGIKIFNVSTQNNSGIEELRELFKNKLTVLTGQSAVGKTSIVNALFNLNLPTGDLSNKISRGKHTTTRLEIFEQDDIRLIDSPGFAVLDAFVSANELPTCYPEYESVSSMCKFRGCAHVSEPECKVKELVDKGEFSHDRYQRYTVIYNEISKRRIIYEKD